MRPVQRGLGTLQEPATADEASGPADHRASCCARRWSAAGRTWTSAPTRNGSQAHAAAARAAVAPAVLIALFAGVPDRIELEEPHHGIQFGAPEPRPTSSACCDDAAHGNRPTSETLGGSAVPQLRRSRSGSDPELRVVEIAALGSCSLRGRPARSAARPRRPEQIRACRCRPAAPRFAIELLQPPWRQVYADEGDVRPEPAVAARLRPGRWPSALDVGALDGLAARTSDDRRRSRPSAASRGCWCRCSSTRWCCASRRRGSPTAACASPIRPAAAAGAAAAAVRRPGGHAAGRRLPALGASGRRSPTPGQRRDGADGRGPGRCRPCPTAGSSTRLSLGTTPDHRAVTGWVIEASGATPP